MCFFITVAVKAEHEHILKKKLRSSYSIAECYNPSLAAYFEPDDVLYFLTSGMCACDLYHRPRLIEDQETVLRRKYSKPKYQKAGWTQAKIERAIADSLTKPTTDFSGLRADVRWSLCDLVNDVGRAFVFVHMYSGNLVTESILVTGQKTVSCKDLQEGGDMIEADTIIEITI